ncbi:MAG: tolR protein [Bdellovibrionales bacterium RIFCSPHIGHO2_01_FULL_40_29]|nr:MAG: tolR protein [Bdellovibrionales bacterium RIFCSPHIGHO2_01_FULL_40_29]OFZ35468.1 MAG: tolR protein [Bdellovibrionales bacterium RIFCSPHIGHO2_02_FULL_40_15]
MAHISSGGGRGRDVNTELNLVPVIDLMSVLITFLLITAVWTQVSMIQLGASFASPRDPEQKELKPPPLEDVVLKLEIRKTGYVLFVGKDVRPIPKLSDAYDNESLEADLIKIKQLYPDKAGVKMAIEDDIMYEVVVGAMDTGLRAGFSPELLTGGPN